MVKIIGICGSHRRKSSYAALREALDGALETGDVEVELIELRSGYIYPDGPFCPYGGTSTGFPWRCADFRYTW